MKKEDMEYINGLAIATTQNAETDYKFIVVPNGFTLHNSEKFNLYKNRFSGKLNTRSFDDFIAYGKKYASETQPAQCFIESEELCATTIFDLGTVDKPLHGVHKAILELEKSSAYEAILDINGEDLNQRKMAEFLEDWQHYITGYNAQGEEINIKHLINAVRKITIESARKAEFQENDFNTSRSIMENVEANRDQNLPDYIVFCCTPYPGLQQRNISLRLSITTDSEKPYLKLRINSLQSLQEEIANEFKANILVAFKDTNVETFIGSFIQ